MRSLSGGMKRRVLVGQALVHKPPVIVLDEPTAGVDVELRQSLWAFIRKLNRDGHTIILTTHYLEEAEALCGRIAMLKAGRVVALDTKQNLLSRVRGTHGAPGRRSDFPPRGTTACRAADDGRCSSSASSARRPRVAARGAARRGASRIEELTLDETDLEQVFLQHHAAARRRAALTGGRATDATSSPAPGWRRRSSARSSCASGRSASRRSPRRC